MEKDFPTAYESVDRSEGVEPGQPYWVQCKNYRCLAKLNENGRWQAVATGQEVTDIIMVYPG